MVAGRKKTQRYNRMARVIEELLVAKVARLTHDQKVACKNHVEVNIRQP